MSAAHCMETPLETMGHQDPDWIMESAETSGRGVTGVWGREGTPLPGDLCEVILSAEGVCGIRIWDGDVFGVKVLTGAVCGIMLMGMLLAGGM